MGHGFEGVCSYSGDSSCSWIGCGLYGVCDMGEESSLEAPGPCVEEEEIALEV